MFQKFIGARKKDKDFFHIPEKKYTCDQKIISKMGTGALKDLVADQDKYVALLIEKIEHAKTEYDRLNDKVDEMQEKNEVVNAQISRMTNEHEQLTIKFDNLQTSLEIVSSESDQMYRKELQFLNQHEVNCEKIRNLNSVINVYRERFALCKKIEQQNKSLKTRYSQLEQDLEEAQNAIKEYEKEKSYNSMIPSLMQEIQELRQASGRNERQKQDVQDSFNKRDEELKEKVGNQLETVSTLRMTEDQDLQEKYRVACIELQKKTQEIRLNKERLNDLQEKNQELSFNFGKTSQKTSILESQLAKANNLIRKYESQFTEIQKSSGLQQDLEKATQSNKQLLNQMNEMKVQNKKLSERVAEINKTYETKQALCIKLSQQLKAKDELIQSKQVELTRQKDKRMSFEQLLSNKSNSQTDSLMKIKARNENEIQQLRQNGDSLKKALAQTQSKVKQLIEELQTLKVGNKRLVEQKQMIQQNANTCLKISQEQSEKLKALERQSKKQISELKKEQEATSSRVKSLEDETKNLTSEIQKLFKSLQGKEAELKKNYAYIQQLQKQKTNINQIIGQKQQDNKIRIRKYESQLNQQRIKIENLNRKLANFQTKTEESKISMDNMYEQLLSKDKKIVHMETKLKEYKYIIQVQKKEKHELEESYEKAVNSLKPTEVVKSEAVQKENSPLQTSEKQVDHQKENLKNELLSIKEQNIVLLSENEALRRKIEELEETIHQKTKNIKILQEKRDQILKEIEKMNKKSNIQEQSSMNSLSSPSILRIESKEYENRQKKIAAKAHKGFDILLKLQHQLYKNFINVFAVDLNRQQVKSIESEINTILTKSSDMRDIFEDYL